MSWPHYRETVTVMDVLETGACHDGVCEWIESHDGVISGRVADYAVEEILEAALADGYCSRGFSSSNGYGNGNGNGNGYGNGYGNGHYGNGDGNGDGYGYGYGDGNGDGNGDGYGDGNGY